MDRDDDPDQKAPPLNRWVREPLALPKIVLNGLRRPAVSEQFGEEQPAIVFPGMMSGDRSTSLLRRSLDAAGYRSYPSGLQFARGISKPVYEALEVKLDGVFRECSQPVTLIGWSLGGVYARVLAQRHPEQVAMVVTLGTPFSGDRRANNAWRVYEVLNDHKVDAPPIDADPSIKPDVKTLAIWSAVDGVIPPACARGLSTERDEEYEIPFKHLELGSSRRAIAAILKILRDASAG